MSIRIALAQINSTVGDLGGNGRKIADYIEQARLHGVDLVVFPELAVTGYPPEDLLFKKHFVRDNLNILKSLAYETLGIGAIVGFVDSDKEGNIYNAAAVLHDGKLKGVYHKMLLPNYGVFDEKRYFTAGKSNTIFRLDNTTFGVTICEDIWKTDGPQQAQAKAGANVLINLSSSPYHAGKVKEREKMLMARAKENKTFICYVNLVGGQDELVFDGASVVVDSKGKICARGHQFKEDLILADIPIGIPRRVAPAKGIKKIILSTAPVKTNKTSVSKNIASPLAPDEEIYQALVLGTQDYILKNGFKKALIGLSGGVDSSLVAAIAVDALGRENVVGVTMPSRFSSPETQSDAKKTAQNLGIRFMEIPIEGIQENYLETLSGPFAGTKTDITEENLQARIRGTILMALSNKFGWLVLTTGNKSEVAVGYCTLYGDMAGGFAVIKDVPKTVVYKLAKFRNEKAKQAVIPQSVMVRPPTAELREDQKDEDSLPPYHVLDPMIEAYVEKNNSLAKWKGKNTDAPLAQKIARMIDKSEYKRRQAPPGIKITPRAFGKDRRFPITNGYQE